MVERRMNKIFIDLEFCGIDRQNEAVRKITPFEIIEIGAVKLNDRDEIVDEYDSYIHPVYGSIEKEISELTHITNEDVAEARPFAEVMEEFLDWIGDEETTVYSWSMSDHAQLEKECRLKSCFDQRVDDLLTHWIDFQKVFGGLIGIEQSIALDKALTGAGLTFDGMQHRANSDAINTAKLYQLTQDEEQFQKQLTSIFEWLKPSPDLTVTMGSLLPPGLLGDLPAE